MILGSSRNSGLTIRVTLCLDLSGNLEFSTLINNDYSTLLHPSSHHQHSDSSSTIFSTSSNYSSNGSMNPTTTTSNGSHKRRELTIGYLALPISDSISWSDLDQQFGLLLEEYLHRIDPDMTLGVDSYSSIIGYQIVGCCANTEENSGSLTTIVRSRAILWNNLTTADSLSIAEKSAPSMSPMETLLPTTSIRLRLSGIDSYFFNIILNYCLFSTFIITLVKIFFKIK